MEVFSDDYLQSLIKKTDRYLYDSITSPNWNKSANSSIDDTTSPLSFSDTTNNELHQSELYSLSAGGKRVRASLVFATYTICKSNNINRSIKTDDISNIIPVAASVEALHTYSLIHDDLPSMDNADTRRGKAANHVAFGEWQAILTGDALLTKAFEILATSELHPKIIQSLVKHLSIAAGDRGMVEGQYFDMQVSSAPNKSDVSSIDIEKLQLIHSKKTGALFRYSCLAGFLATVDAETQSDKLLHNSIDPSYNIVSEIGKNFGQMFQIMDDIIDVVSTNDKAGKTVKQDIQNGKITYPSLIGLEESYKEFEKLYSASKQNIEKLCKIHNYDVNSDLNILNQICEKMKDLLHQSS